MNQPVDIQLATDLLWNSTDPERYATLVKRADPEVRYQSTNELRKEVFGYYEYFEGGETKEDTRLGWHLNRNMYCPQPGKNEYSVKLGGINLFVKTDDGEYYLSEEGIELRELYVSGDVTEWKAKLAELVLKYSIRVRCIIYYLGVHGCNIYSDMGTFRGDEYLEKGDLKYKYYGTDESSNGAYTANYYTEKLTSYGAIGDDNILHRLYDLEHLILATGFSLESNHQQEILRLKDATKSLVGKLEAEDLDENVEEHPEISSQLRRDVARIEADLSNLIKQIDVSEPNERFDYVPNLLIDANFEHIVGPFCMQFVEKYIGEVPNDFRLRGVTTDEPGGSKIVEVTRHGLRLLTELGILVEEDSGILRHNTARSKELLNEDVVADLFAIEHAVDDTQAFMKTFESAYIKQANTDGVVFWPDIVDAVTNQLQISKEKFHREIENRVSTGEIAIKPVDLGQPYHGSPPGFDESYVWIEFQ